MAIEGIDYADARPNLQQVWAAGKRFVVRYGGPGRDGKHLHADELRKLLDIGFSVVANAEGASDGFATEAAGRSWARQADAHFKALGMPADRPIYFSIDFDAGAADWGGIDAALRGAAAEIGLGRVGVYGGYKVIAHCVTANNARWFWQTYAWSSGRWHSAAHIQQYHNGVNVGGGDCDLNRAMKTDFGQWGQEDLMTTAEDVVAELLGSKIPTANGDKTVLQILGNLEVRTDATNNKQLPAIKTEISSVKAQSQSNGSALSVLSSRPVLDPSALVAAITSGVVAGVTQPSVPDEQVAQSLVLLLGVDRARAIAALITAG